MFCRNCGTKLNDDAKFCLGCGCQIIRDEAPAPVVETPAPAPVVETPAPVVETPAPTPVVKTPAPAPVVETPAPAPVVNTPAPAAGGINGVWPEWTIEKQLGRGSYGVVYKAIRKDNNVESHAAIKVISIPSDASEIDSLRSEGLDMDGTRSYFKGIVDEFVGEIQLMESLKGIQNIVSVEDYKVVERTNTIGWDIYIRMELLTPFNTYICDKELSEQEVIKLGSDICSALEICDKRNVIHRDIKPENIFVNDFGHYKLGDFGIARKLENVTGGLSQKGTFNYMAPEVANSNTYDARVDTYSLGIVLYRLLNGNRLPLLADKQLLNPNERKMAVDRRLRGEALPAPSNASPSMAHLVLRACAFNPADRFASASEMKQALAAVQNGTYAVEESDLDKTTSVRLAEQINYDATTAVRRSTNVAVADKETPEVASFGDAPKKKKKKGKFIAIGILALILALVIGAAVLFFTGSAYSVNGKMDDGDYAGALEEYHSGVKDNFIQDMILDLLMGGRVDTVKADYDAGKMDYDTAVAELEALKEMGFDNAQKTIDAITADNEADTSLEKADQYYSDGDYESAIEEYSKVPEGNENYDKAQEQLTKVYADYIDDTVAKANQHKSYKEYKEAVRLVNTAYGVLPDSVDTSALDTIKEECLASYKTDVNSEVDALVDNEEFTEAFTVIDEAIAFDDNVYFQELKTSTQNEYVEYITATVEKHLDKEDYISAQRVADNALTVLPGNATLKELQEKVKKATPTYLLDVCEPYASNSFTAYKNGELITMGGNSYTNGFTLGSNGSAVFNVDSRYNTLSFTTGHIDGTDMRAATIKVYCDGILKEEFTMGAEDLPIKHVIDITGVSQIKIQISDMRYYGCGYGFANVTVK